MFQRNIPSIVQGLCQVLSCLAVIEISPAGLEATIYELLVSAMNGAMALSAALQSQFAAPFHLDEITQNDWFHYGCPGHNVTANATACNAFKSQSLNATWMTLCVNLVGVLIFMWFMPKNAAHCREWRDKGSWDTHWAAILNIVIFAGPCSYAIYTTLSFA